jgi:lipopolysaccharide biosynthesis glycosyltransferase
MTIDIVVSLNRAIAISLLVVMNSIVQNTQTPDVVRFNVVIPEGERDFFTTQIETAFPERLFRYRLAEFTPPEFMKTYLDNRFREKTPERQRSRYMQYSRLFIKEIFPDVRRVIYFDTDIVVLGDVAQLFSDPVVQSFSETRYVAAVPQFFPCFMYFQKPWQVLGEIRQFKKSFNSGVLLTDVGFWSEATYERLRYYLDLDRRYDYRLYNLGDETVLNLMFKDYWPLARGWNWCGFGNIGLVTSALRFGVDLKQKQVIHWSGGHYKPWRNPKIAFADLWARYLPESAKL